ncbi:ABC transporter permease [Actinoalloteichus hymeniacidonis]|uniref:Autoinducer 2 import system permease protein LsrD n=1 Tax=Actinoalloteichus hymeniacidonis TaxID=340345 RepID=A0AAC9HU21_9PSEU|nr:ABC transporter permease [Actinoalloteichus hymeniacidonis]AOS65478.1 permease component of ribose/xylose/arabinose/galactoside ABC-type transporters [Actinoalloteichus hymeniacidonis]MBB5906435.1 rhamnose transport system permease protein [Actinoalloteichus hymeniacidonis]
MPPETRQPARRRTLPTWDFAIVGVLLAVLVTAGLSVEGFAASRNIGFLLLDVLVIALIALPLTLVVVTGEIDLSVASTVGLTSAVMGSLWVSGLSLELIVVLCILLGGVLGAVNGLLVTGFGLPSLAVTIGTLALYRGLAFVVLGDQAVADFPADWTGWAIGSLGDTGIPNAVLPLVLLAAVFIVVLHATPIGRGLYAMGNNTEAAVFAGIAVRRTKFWLFVATGAVSGLGGVFWTLRFASARADNATGLELLVVAAVLLGGVSIFGGSGGLFGVLAAVLLLGSLRNALQLVNVSSDALNVLTGLLLIISVVVPAVLARRRSRRRPRGRPAVAGSATSTNGPSPEAESADRTKGTT